jgi:uncharacterized protein
VTEAAPDRIAALDLIRGIAVLGILAVNIAGFAGGPIGVFSPNFPEPGTAADNAAFAGTFLLFEGKLRALFTLMFGASMLLFIARTEANERNGAMLQAKRLIWLMLFGYLHFVLLWWGDILFTYAVIGLCLLPLRRKPVLVLAISAVVFFLLWHARYMVLSWPDLMRDEAVRLGQASGAQFAEQQRVLGAYSSRYAGDLALHTSGFWHQAGVHITAQGLLPIDLAVRSIGETAPLMVLGMVLYRSGFFAGAWPRRALRAMAVGGIGLGGALTLLLLAWAEPRGFPPVTMVAFLVDWTAIPHLLMALGYIAALMLAAPWLLTTRLGTWLAAAGRMAFSNYLGTTLVMTFIFHGWGLGLAGQYGHFAQLGFVLLGWVLMLAWSKPWLNRYRQGPLEWLWRSLTEQQRLAFRQ